MHSELFDNILHGIRHGDVVPYIGPGALNDTCNSDTGTPIPADSDSLILAMTNGQALSPRLMYEFPRAAMHYEHKRGRNFVTSFLADLYGKTSWTRSTVHDWLAEERPPYVIDINRDTQLQDTYSKTAHTLIVGISRIAGTAYRFRIFNYDGTNYREIAQEAVDRRHPVLFKPLGTPRPDPTFIASDADFVDYITELMGGFAIPSFLKECRQGKQYLLIGMRLTRDTERMVLSDLTYAAGRPRGWALIPDPSPKERRFCSRLGIEIIEAEFDELLYGESKEPKVSQLQRDASSVGC